MEGGEELACDWGQYGRHGRVGACESSFASLVHSRCCLDALVQASLIPTRISSLLLTSTKSGAVSELPTLKAAHLFLRLLTGTVWSPAHAISLITDSLYPVEYLDQPAKGEGQEGKTRREVHEAVSCMD